MALFAVSAIYSPSPLTARPRGWLSGAATSVRMLPPSITRTRLFSVSAIYTTSRFGSQATPYGELSFALAAELSSPAKPKLPVPATVLMTAVWVLVGLSIGGAGAGALRISWADVLAILTSEHRTW